MRYEFSPEQLAWLQLQLAQSDATWKVIASDMPLSLVVSDGPKGGSEAFIIQARRPPDANFRALIQSHGATICGYVPNTNQRRAMACSRPWTRSPVWGSKLRLGDSDPPGN